MGISIAADVPNPLNTLIGKHACTFINFLYPIHIENCWNDP
jgi:hypothetical protein